MIRISSSYQKIQAKLAAPATTNQLPVTVSYSDRNSNYTGSSQLTNTNDSTSVDICDAPQQGFVRDIDYLSVVNLDTDTAIVSIIYNNNGTTYNLMVASLAVGDQLMYADGSGWVTLDSSGAFKQSGLVGSSGSGAVSGPGSSTDNAIALWDGTSGNLLKNSTASAVRATLGLVIGTDVQAYDADLTTWAGVTPGTGVATALAVATNGTGGFPTTDGTATLSNKTLSSPTITGTAGFSSEYDNGNSGASKTITLTNGQKQKITLTATATLTVSSTSAKVGHYQIRLIQDGASGWLVTWAGLSASRWLGSASAPAVNVESAGETIVTVYFDGTNMIQSMSKVGV